MPFKAAAIQFSPVVGDVKGNVERARGFVEQAAQAGARLVCLPEMFNTGYFCHTSHCDIAYFDLAEDTDGHTMGVFRRVAAERRLYIALPFFEREREGLYYNSCYLIDDQGEIVGRYRKTHIPWSHTGWEKFYIRPGYDWPVWKTPYGSIGVLICYDRDFPEAARTLALNGADLILIPNGASEKLTEMWKRIVSVRAYENQLFVLGACLTGKVDEEHHAACGHSLLAEPGGGIVGMLGREEAALVVEIDCRQLHRARTERFMCRDRRPEIYSKLTQLN